MARGSCPSPTGSGREHRRSRRAPERGRPRARRHASAGWPGSAPKTQTGNPVLEPLFRTVRANHPKADLALLERAYDAPRSSRHPDAQER